MNRLIILSWVVPLGVAAWLLSLGIAEPWTGSYDANGALFSTAARNYLRYGLAATRGCQVANGGLLEPDEFRFYTHHPPGISLAIAASFALLGTHEWSARLVPILFTLGAVACLYLVGRELGGALVGFLAATVFALQPMVAFYGRMPGHEAPAAFFALAMVFFYLRWRRSGRGAWLAAVAAAALLGAWFAWVVFVLPWLLLAHHWLTRRAGWARMLVPVAAGAVGFVGVLGHIAAVEGGLGDLAGALTHRVGSQAGDHLAKGAFGLAEFLGRQGHYFWLGYSGVAACLFLAWVLGMGRRRAADTLLVGALALFGLLSVVGFKQGAFVHIYYQFYLAAPLALAAGLALADASRRKGGHWAVAVACLVAFIGVEGWVRLAAIRGSRFYLEQLPMAAWVCGHTAPRGRVLILAARPSSYRQLTWYADRNITMAYDAAAARRLWEKGGYTEAFWVLDEGKGTLAPLWPTGATGEPRFTAEDAKAADIKR